MHATFKLFLWREPANKILLHFSKDKVIVEAKTPDIGESEEELQVESNSSEEITIGLNAQFLIDSMREIDESNIVIVVDQHGNRCLPTISNAFFLD